MEGMMVYFVVAMVPVSGAIGYLTWRVTVAGPHDEVVEDLHEHMEEVVADYMAGGYE